MFVVGLTSPNRINHVSLISQANTAQHPLQPGIWQGHYQLWRQGRLLIDVDRQIEVKGQ